MNYIRFFGLSILLYACMAPSEPAITWKSIERSLQEQLITAADGDTINLPSGHFKFSRGLTLDGKKNLVIRGAGTDSTVLSFAGQSEGAQGLLATNCTNLTFEHFTIEDARGDNIKVSDSRGITFRHIRSRWTAEPSSENGAYALYPVLCKNVLIEDCEAVGSSDAGIYVGQSDSVIIRNNKAWHNVAGIESENSRWVEIYGNEAWDNTGGLLVFDLPGLTQTGHHTRIFGNNIHDNNHSNFAAPGNVVASIPPGTGIMLLATRDLEMTDNTIVNNRTVGTGIISYDLVSALTETEAAPVSGGDAQTYNQNYKLDTAYNPYPSRIRIQRNHYRNDHWFPTLEHDIGLLFLTKSFMDIPDIAYDGIRPDGKEPEICFSENGESITFLFLDAGNDFQGLRKNPAGFDCGYDPRNP